MAVPPARFFWRPAAALFLVLSVAWLTFPTPKMFLNHFGRFPGRSVAVGVLALALAYLLVRAIEAIVVGASRRPRQVSERGLFGFLLGLLSAALGISLWFAFVAAVTAPLGLFLGVSVLRRETRDQEGHSLLNLSGIALNATGLIIFASQVLSSTIWR